jgi:hypothetical protein
MSVVSSETSPASGVPLRAETFEVSAQQDDIQSVILPEEARRHHVVDYCYFIDQPPLNSDPRV